MELLENQLVVLTDFFTLDYCGPRRFRLVLSYSLSKLSGTRPSFLRLPEWLEGRRVLHLLNRCKI